MFRILFCCLLMQPLLASSDFEERTLFEPNAKDQIQALQLLTTRLTNDGKTNLIRLTQTKTGYRAEVLHDAEHLIYKPIQALDLDLEPELATSADFNGDGHGDLLISTTSGDAALYLGTDQDRFGEAIEIHLPAGIRSLQTADLFRRDGISDLIVHTLDETNPTVFHHVNGILRAEPRMLSDDELAALPETLRDGKPQPLRLHLNDDRTLDPIILAQDGRIVAQISKMRASYDVNSTNNVDDGTCDGVHCSLVEAVNAANANPGHDIITFAGLGSSDDIQVGYSGSPSSSEYLVFTDSVTIDGTTNPGGHQVVYGVGVFMSTAMKFEADGNVIKGMIFKDFGGVAVDITHTSNNNLVEQCIFGSDITGENNHGANIGLRAYSDGNQIGVDADGRGNQFMFNLQWQLQIWGNDNTVVNNRVALYPTSGGGYQTNAYGFNLNGHGNTIGGTTAFAPNYFAGKRCLRAESILHDALIQGNQFNITPEGDPLDVELILTLNIVNGDNLTIGGTTPAAANVLAGDRNQRLIYLDNVTNATVQGNFIGITPSGTVSSDRDTGIFILGNSTDIDIGGPDPSMANTIAGTLYGIQLHSGPMRRIQMIGNNISSTQFGIVFGNTFTTNDSGDSDTGINYGMNHPQDISLSVNGSDELLLSYRVDTNPASHTYPLRVDFYETQIVNSADMARIIATDTYTSSDYSSGIKTLNLGPYADLNLENWRSLIAMATDADGNSSVPSQPFYFNPPGSTTLTVNSLDDQDNDNCNTIHCSLREAINLSNFMPGEQTIAFNLPAPYEIFLSPAHLPALTDEVVIDGSTQPGFSGTPIVMINGKNITGSFGINLAGGNSTIQDVIVNRFLRTQVTLSSDNNTIRNCWLGYDDTGVDVQRDGDSIDVLGHNNIIGGALSSNGNRLFHSDIFGNNNHFFNNMSNGSLSVWGNNNLIGDDSNPIGNHLAETSINGDDNRISNNLFGLSDDGSAASSVRVGAGLRVQGDGNDIGSFGRNIFVDNHSAPTHRALDIIGSDNIVHNNTFGLAVDGQTALPMNTAISVSFGANATITENIITNGTLGITSSGTTTISDNLIGTDSLGLSGRGNEVGIRLLNGSALIQDNIISDSGTDGIQIAGGSHTVLANQIGLNAAGDPLGNQGNGILISSPDNQIGSLLPNMGNTISGNGLHGIRIRTFDASGNVILGNVIGANMSGTMAIPNLLNGVSIENAPNNQVGNNLGGNLISGNGRGVYITGLDALTNRVENNLIGTNDAADDAIPNAGNGVEIDNASSNQVIDNIIGGNGGTGVSIHESGAVANRVSGNQIGVAGASDALPNGISGVSISDAPGNFIGGSNAGEANVIGFNKLYGIHVSGKGSNTNQIVGNYVGTDPTGSLNLGNQVHGIVLRNIASHNTVGGSALNVVAFNGGDGIRVTDGIGNDVGLNLIYDNLGMGIDLNGDGLTANDITDNDVGGNMLLNYPELTGLIDNGGSITINGSLTSHPNRNFVIRFYLNDSCNPGGYGEGQEIIGDASVTTAANGVVSFSETFNLAISAGQVVTATTLDSDGNVSEFSRCEGVSTFADGFETGDTSRWVVEGGARGVSNLDISEEARYDGLYGLRVYPGENAYRLRDDSPADETRYRLRFYANFSNINVPNDAAFDFFTAQNSQNEDVLRLQLTRLGGNLLIMPHVRLDDGTWSQLNGIAVEAGWQLMELDMLAASEGHLILFTNGNQVAAIDQLDNDLSAVDSIRVGVVSSPTGSVAGFLDLDDFKAGRDLYIGAVICTPVHIWGNAMENWPNSTITNFLDLATTYCR